MDEWIKVWFIYNGILFSLKKEGNPAICYNMGQPGGYSVKWNKPDPERQLLYNPTYMQNQKKWNSS